MERNPVTVTSGGGAGAGGGGGGGEPSDQDEKKSTSAADYMLNFKNIIAPGNEASMTREFNPQVAYEFEKYLNPLKLKQHVLKSDKLRSILEHYAKESGQPVKQLERQAKAIIEEIGLERNMAIIRWCGIAITAIGKRICDGFYVNSASMLNVRKDMGKCPVLYLPSHRSYMDFILMSYICYYYDIEIPGIAAGMDFHSMFGMGTMLRKTGAFFMRRSFSNDELYWDIFREYMYALVANYHIGVEFFIEGTRSRNFKALVPKIGLLSMALLPYFTGEVPDVMIVPVSVAYERVLEEQLFVYELLGVPKPKESTKGFFKALKIIDERFGKMFLDFGEPISVKEFFGHDSSQRMQRAGVGGHLQKLNRQEVELVKQLANEIIYQQQRRIVITTFNLLSLYYASQLYAQKSVNIDELSRGVLHLKRIFEQLGAHVSTRPGSIKADIIDAVEIHSNILHFVSARLQFTPMAAKQLADKIDVKRLKAHALCPQTMAVAVPMLALQLYVNPCMFWLARPAYLLLAALKEQRSQQKCLDSSSISYDSTLSALHAHVTNMDALFQHEFIIESNREAAEFETHLQLLLDERVVEVAKNGRIRVQDNECSHVILAALAPFLCLYYQLVVTLRKIPLDLEFSNKDLLVRVQKHVEQLLQQPGGTAFHVHPYCLALDNLNIAIYALIQRGYLLKSRDSGQLKIPATPGKCLEELERQLLEYCQLMPFAQYSTAANQQAQFHIAKL
ncbi:hypothetical protein KR032_004601 [Drosophila birchii]|nr:hypothetical protein KR032_004601 [Drosophila birchii]